MIATIEEYLRTALAEGCTKFELKIDPRRTASMVHITLVPAGNAGAPRECLAQGERIYVLADPPGAMPPA